MARATGVEAHSRVLDLCCGRGGPALGIAVAHRAEVEELIVMFVRNEAKVLGLIEEVEVSCVVLLLQLLNLLEHLACLSVVPLCYQGALREAASKPVQVREPVSVTLRPRPLLHRSLRVPLRIPHVDHRRG